MARLLTKARYWYLPVSKAVETTIGLVITDKYEAQRRRAQQEKILAQQNPNKQKLDELVDIIHQLNDREKRYMKWLQNEQLVQEQQPIWAENIRTPPDVDPRNYFLQEELIAKNWQFELKFMDVILGTIEVEAKVEKKVEAKAKEIFDVELQLVAAADKIKVIKAIRESMGLGLKEAKELVEKTPVVIKQAKKDDAQALAAALTKAGCNVIVK